MVDISKTETTTQRKSPTGLIACRGAFLFLAVVRVGFVSVNNPVSTDFSRSLKSSALGFLTDA
jgi:hypothetical protein